MDREVGHDGAGTRRRSEPAGGSSPPPLSLDPGQLELKGHMPDPVALALVADRLLLRGLLFFDGREPRPGVLDQGGEHGVGIPP